MVCDVLQWQKLTWNEKGTWAAKMDNYQLHELQNVEAHPNSFGQGGSVPTIDARLGGLDHGLNITVPHWSTMAFESFSKNLKETRGVPNAMVDFLLDQLWIQYRSDVIFLSRECVERGLERGRSNG